MYSEWNSGHPKHPIHQHSPRGNASTCKCFAVAVVVAVVVVVVVILTNLVFAFSTLLALRWSDAFLVLPTLVWDAP